MAVNGVKTLVKIINEFKEMHYERRLKLFIKTYPRFKEDPCKIEPRLKKELSNFLKRLEKLSQEIEESKDETLTPEAVNAIASVESILSAWDMSTKKVEIELEKEDDADEFIFKFEI